MNLTLNKAAKMCGRAKSTILEAIRDGRLSASKNAKGHYSIDPAELSRVFPFEFTDHTNPVTERTQEPQPTTLENTPNANMLEREVNLLREMLEKAETNADHWRKMAERQQSLIEDNRPKGFFKRLLGQ
jgi:hypothetical protein